MRPRPGLVVYNSSKGAAISMTKSLAIELAPDNIPVTAVNPVANTVAFLASDEAAFLTGAAIEVDGGRCI